MAETPDAGAKGHLPSEGSQIFARHRDLLGVAVLGGDSVVAISAAIALRDHAPAASLLTWAVIAIVSSYGWEFIQRLYPSTDRRHDQIDDRLGWVATIAWAALPWMVIGSVDQGEVAWILVFVVGFGIATDLLYQSPTETPELDVQLILYPGSYVAAFAVQGQWLPIVAVGATAFSLVVAVRVWLDVNEVLVERRTRIEEDAKTDPLTGLATRTAATETVETLARSGHADIYCAFIDIDDFKYLNDNHGYAVGDQVLRAVGRDLVAKLPRSWTVARFGGDEFVAVGPEPADLQPILESALTIDGPQSVEIAQSLTVGITSLPADGVDPAALFREAASALRHAKRLGKHQVVEVTPQLREIDASRSELGRRAGAALDAGEIMPWAQLIVDLETGEPAGLELLARWVQPDGTVISPADFIPVIEEQGRGPALGMVMIDHAIAMLAQVDVREAGLFISVNVSARHLYHRRLPREVGARLRRHGVDADRLILEVTESEHLPSSPIWRETAEGLLRMGVGLAMDDLGTGYSTVSKLLDVPFSHVKVDRVFTQSLDRPGTAQLAAAFATIASGAGMSSVVEGIETEEQAEAMRAAGYRLGQGFLFHRPEPLEDAVTRAVRRLALQIAPSPQRRSA